LTINGIHRAGCQRKFQLVSLKSLKTSLYWKLKIWLTMPEIRSLPAPTQIVEESIIGPTLGQEALNQRFVIYGEAGLLFVVINIMVALYMLKVVLVAIAALVFKSFLSLGHLAQLGGSIDLPVSQVNLCWRSYSIDANVLNFSERIKEWASHGVGCLMRLVAG